MIRNYFKTALRNFWKNKATGFINLFGLSIGMTAAVFIFLWVQNEISFDNYQPDKNKRSCVDISPLNASIEQLKKR